MTSADGATPRGSSALAWVGWILTVALLGYAGLLHKGMGPIPRNLQSNWYNPDAFLLHAIEGSSLGGAMESTGSAIALLALPALAVAIAVFLTTGSAVARMLGATSVIAAVLFVYYGVQAPGVWKFFHWRWSACMALFSLCLGLSITAPLLAESWRRRSWPSRLLIYLPLFAAAVVFERNVTGTDDQLVFAISPWPVVQVFGLEVLASAIALLLVGVATGLWIASGGRERKGGALIALFVAGALVTMALPTAGILLGSTQDLLPFRAGPRLLTTVAVIALASFAMAASLGRSRDLGGRARIWALGGLLLGLPLVIGQTLTRLDYTSTRDVRAGSVIDALQSHYEQESVYPESLEELVQTGALEEIPRPRIGFLSEQEFVYQSFGTSYILEFSAPRWIQCAYNPPYLDEFEEEEEEEGEDLGGAWSCPRKPPELW
jgi:hypothetical protein